MNKVAWIVFSLLAVGLLAVLVIFSNSTKLDLDVSSVDTKSIQTGNSQSGDIADHVFGNKDSTVTLINYGDYQCPGCGTAHPRIKKITEDYKDKIRFIFRNFPLSTIHSNAKAAAGAVEAAGLQGKYWEMHNKIYESQDSWNTLIDTERSNYFTAAAKELGLDTDKFNTDMASKSVTDKINYDRSLGVKDGVDATPTFILNGVKMDADSWGDDTVLRGLIDAELIKAGISLP